MRGEIISLSVQDENEEGFGLSSLRVFYSVEKCCRMMKQMERSRYAYHINVRRLREFMRRLESQQFLICINEASRWMNFTWTPPSE